MNMRQKLICPAFLLILAVAFGTASCKHEIPTPSEELTTDSVCDTNTVYFVNDILPLFVSSCAMYGCHDAATHTEGFTLDSYEGIMDGIDAGDPGSSKIFERITDSDPDDQMPPPSSGITLTQAQIDMIYDWIAQGAHNNQCIDSGSGCDTVNVTFSGTVAPIFSTYCLGCHSGAFPSGSIDLSAHSGASAVALDGRLMGALNHDSPYSAMPQGQAQLDTCLRAKIAKWVNAGAPNN
jgi:hypothetical protein